jgi:hypothetical protein
MQFLVYLTILMVSVSTVLLEIHWLTTPPPQPKSAVQASATPPRPKVEGPNAELSPVYPKKLGPVQPSSAVANDTAAKIETGQKPAAETTGVATRADDSTRSAIASLPDNAQNAQAYAAPPKKNAPDEAAASNNRCDVQVCASAYKSFRASDCTYQPLDGRGACAASCRSSVPTATKETSRNVGPGAGTRLRVKGIEECGGGSMMRMTTTRTMRFYSAEAAAGRRGFPSKSPPT